MQIAELVSKVKEEIPVTVVLVTAKVNWTTLFTLLSYLVYRFTIHNILN